MWPKSSGRSTLKKQPEHWNLVVMRHFLTIISLWRTGGISEPTTRLNREIRRRTRVVGSFPDGHAALMLVAARLRYMAGQKWGTQRYMNMNQEVSA